MIDPRSASFALPSPEATCAFAQRFAPVLARGDALLLSGGIGAGKTHFARCVIRALQQAPEDVPSPSFTLVQEYDTRAGPLWHADLYRLGGPEEILELGLVEAFDTAICIVEWPDRLQDMAPVDALSLHFADGPEDEARSVTLRWIGARWDAALPELAA